MEQQHGSFDCDGDQHPALSLVHDPQETSQLVEDLRDFLHNPDYEQAIHDAVIAAGVPERLAAGKVNSLLPLPTPAQQQLARATAGTLSSAQSTITLNAIGADQVQDSGPCRASAAAGLEIARQKRMSSELKQEVESLLQRTDSILSRSSGHSTLHGTPASHLPGLTVNTAGSSPHGCNSLQELGGFDFETGSQTLETPTFSKSGSRETGGSFTRRLAGEGGRRRTLTTGGVDGTATGPRLSNSSLTPPIGSSSHGMGLPGPDFVGQMGVVQEEGGPYCAGSNSGRQPFSLASRLSQQALSEIKDRLDGPEAMSRFSSGYSGTDQTTVVLEKSASWRQRAAAAMRSNNKSSRTLGEGSGSPIYANFAPLEQLVDAALTDSGGSGGPGSVRGVQLGQMGAGAAAVGGGMRERAASGALAKAALSHTSHRLALGYMLQPDYVHSSTLSRLKAELQGMSKPPAGVVSGGSPFDVKLLALTARLSQWANQERTAGETFQQLLESILDNIFARLSPSKGRVAPPKPAAAAAATAAKTQLPQRQQQRGEASSQAPPAAQPTRQQLFKPTSLTRKRESSAAAAAGSCLHKAGSSCSDGGSSMAAVAADAMQRLSQAGTRRTTRTDGSSSGAAAAAAAVGDPKPTDSMLRSAFAKLALGQAKLRQAVGGVAASPAAAAAAVRSCDSIVARGPSGLLTVQPDIGVAQRFSYCSGSSAGSSRQPSLRGEALEEAATRHMRAAMQASAAAAGAGAAAAAGDVAGRVPASDMQSAAVSRRSGMMMVPAGPTRNHISGTSNTAAGSLGAAAGKSCPGGAIHSSTARCTTTGGGGPMQARGHQQPSPRCCKSAGPHPLYQKQQQQQQPQQWFGVCSSSNSSMARSPGHDNHQPWLQQHEQGPSALIQQQQQQQQQLRQSWGESSLQPAGQQDAWPSSKPSKWSPGRDTLELARQAHQQRTSSAIKSPGATWSVVLQQGPAFHYQQQQQQQQQDAGSVVDGFGGSRRSLFAGSLHQQHGQPKVSPACSPQKYLCSHQQQQQQQGWLQAGSPGRAPALGGLTSCGLGSTGGHMYSVRVSTAAAAHASAGGGIWPGTGGAAGPGSPVRGGTTTSSPQRRLRLPLTGGVLDVYADSVEVHSQQRSPILIDVLASGGA